MSLDDMKALWQSQAGGSGPAASDEDILTAVTRSGAELDRQVSRRDRLEIGVGLVVSCLFLPLLWNPSWVVRAGVLLYVAGILLAYVKLRRARRAAAPMDPTAPLLDVIRRERGKVGAQTRLLESVMWWYIAPLCLAAILVFGGLRGLTLPTVVYTLAVGGFGALVLHWNRTAVRQELRPRYEHLTRLLEEAES